MARARAPPLSPLLCTLADTTRHEANNDAPPPVFFFFVSQGRNVLVNLIPYNPTYAPGSEEFKEPTEEALQKFKAIVYEHGLLVTIRR